MKYLYGDSTASPLQSNFLAFVRDAMEFCVHVILAQERIDVLRKERHAVDEHAEGERARIAGLRALVLDAADGANTDGDKSLSFEAVTRVKAATEQAIAATLAALQTKLDADRAALAGKDRDERDGCLAAFGKWVALHEVHEGEWKLSVNLRDSGHYEGETSGAAPYGIAWKYAIELQSGHPMVNGIKVGDLVTQIELAIPEPSGWLKKTKARPQRIDQYSIDSFATDGKEATFALRVTPRAAVGLDVTIRDDKVTVTVAGGKEAIPVDVGIDDRQRLLTLRDRTLEALTTHASVHRRVMTATFDDAPLADGELGVVVKRIINAAAPIVQQIRNHSMSPNELVIRRLLGDDRREEIFVSTASLLEKLGRLPRALRSQFSVLGLDWQRAHTPLPFAAVVVPDEPAEDIEVTAEPEPEPVESTPPPAVSSTPHVELAATEDEDADTKVEEPEPPVAPTPAPAPAPVETAPAPVETAAPPAHDKPAVATDAAASIAIDAANKEALAATVKRIVGAVREGRTKVAYEAYARLFADKAFVQQRPQDQRQVLKLMVLAKTQPQKSQAVLLAYGSALARINALAADGNEPVDNEMVAVCEELLTS